LIIEKTIRRAPAKAERGGLGSIANIHSVVMRFSMLTGMNSGVEGNCKWAVHTGAMKNSQYDFF